MRTTRAASSSRLRGAGHSWRRNSNRGVRVRVAVPPHYPSRLDRQLLHARLQRLQRLHLLDAGLEDERVQVSYQRSLGSLLRLQQLLSGGERAHALRARLVRVPDPVARLLRA